MRTFHFRFRRFNANTCDEGPEILTECSIESPTWENAIYQLKEKLHGYKERFFRSFTVAEDSSSFYRLLDVIGSLPNGTLLITDIHWARFVHPTSAR